MDFQQKWNVKEGQQSTILGTTLVLTSITFTTSLILCLLLFARRIPSKTVWSSPTVWPWSKSNPIPLLLVVQLANFFLSHYFLLRIIFIVFFLSKGAKLQKYNLLVTNSKMIMNFFYPILAIKYYSIFYYNFEFTCVEFVLVSPVEFTLVNSLVLSKKICVEIVLEI